ncbi:acid sphingomyelinase-like phosphodiesterase 3b [Tachyglossus aculeatus]|uniref:acid sphingomyelinase-like phosphodiesterase 3b n=1 Tax=Tachyglossus aculeatus TaxID=9261 RepID=UPI0018F7A320|nr:acid sphingomyelinase-like phosphodiesterase 3b [Tachyglossus aculeatus]
MDLPTFLLWLLASGASGASPGRFWHISDLHLDPDYQVSQDPLQVCPSAGSQPVPNAGKWGNYLCDAPWALLNSSIHAMRDILPQPDFILWTGDDTPHVPDEKLGEEAVLKIVENLTNLIREVFPGTKVYPAMGNHDFHPKNQLPAGPSRIYDRVADLWQPWLLNESIPSFRAGAFYSERLTGPGAAGRMVVLNTNLYYNKNQQTEGLGDPGDQFRWLDELLTNASRRGEKVFIAGHVPPGYFEKKRSQAWFREPFSQRYVELVRKHHGVIAGQFFGHHHTDSFRMFYDLEGVPIGVMFLTPGVTPWKTTLPGVDNGANNPAIRVWEYDRATLQLQDTVTYYFNLTQSAAGSPPRWEEEYRLTRAYRVRDASPPSMQTVLERITDDDQHLQCYYRFNSVSYAMTPCDAGCRVDHICAIREVDPARYEDCVGVAGAAFSPPDWALLPLALLVSLLV